MKILVATLLVLASTQAISCEIIFPEPAAAYDQHRVVVLARPIGIAFKPDQAAATRRKTDFSQTIRWEVLLSWKGTYKSGDTFTTRHEFKSREASCVSPVPDKSAQLLFIRGREPYSDFYYLDPAQSLRYFKFLAKNPVQ